jgi:signal transduction histidine kinase
MPENLTLLQSLLENFYQVFAASNGVIALKIAKNQIPDLILLDIMMPEMDGYEVCRRLKADDSTKEIPIIFITAKSEIKSEIKGFEVGCVDYITKPISPSVLARVRAHMALKLENELLKENMRLREDMERISRHDLKSPLTAIISSSKLFDKSNLTEKQKKQINRINNAGYIMLNMINHSLDLYKMETGIYHYTPVPVDIISILDDIVSAFDKELKLKEIRHEILLNNNVIIQGDQFEVPGEYFLFYSLLSNLIKNAIESSPQNEKIHIRLSNNNHIRIAIHNQGAIHESIRENFFEKYVTFGKKYGTGLGTYSSKLITETMGGEISMISSEESGTTIAITFINMV